MGAWVFVISFCGTKGGVGKTTLCWNAAIHAAREHSILLADLDPQRSLKALWEKRNGSNPLLVSKMKDIASSLALMKEAGLERDYLLIDAPGSFLDLIEDTIMNSDLIVLPLQPSLLDLKAQEDMATMIESRGLLSRTIFVLNRIEGRSVAAERAREFLQYISPSAPLEIKNRAAYMLASDEGKAGCEINKQARAEIEILWDTIQKCLGQEHGQRIGS